MRPTRVTTALTITAVSALLAAGCGWSPKAPPPAGPDTCTTADAPNPEVVTAAVRALPSGPWTVVGSGHTSNCALYWVQVSPLKHTPDSPQQVLFFNHDAALGSPTPNPRPYITVTNASADSVNVQYQWQQANDKPGLPTGIGSVEFTVDGGKLKARGPIPGP
ncbi:hypothetical protein ABIA30_004506 [Mycobacterium sp. MAA66]|uniref:LppP/LprE family lipoprotein n=1 Tax=Mycobacterium sp. MAA66 TaxID=3156297 RepID=UPI003514BE6B